MISPQEQEKIREELFLKDRSQYGNVVMRNDMIRQHARQHNLSIFEAYCKLGKMKQDQIDGWRTKNGKEDDCD